VSAGDTRPPGAVLFVCTSNAIRSVMAAGLMQRRFGRMVHVESVGVRPIEAVDPMAVVVMDEEGVDVSKHRPRGFDALEDMYFDLIITMTPEAHHRALEFTRTMAVEVEYWPTFDPSLAEGSREQRLEEYRAVRDAIDARMAARFTRPSTG